MEGRAEKISLPTLLKLTNEGRIFCFSCVKTTLFYAPDISWQGALIHPKVARTSGNLFMLQFMCKQTRYDMVINELLVTGRF